MKKKTQCYLLSFYTVQFSDEIKERVTLPKKQQVTSQAVSFHCDRTDKSGDELGVIRDGTMRQSVFYDGLVSPHLPQM